MEKVDLIALAGLLHDIGKFRQRTGLNDISDGELATFCPSYKSYYSHIHAAHTAKALDELGLSFLSTLAANHHLQNLEGDEKIIQEADRLASSLDRKESGEELGKKEFITSAIESPFSYVYLEKKPKKIYYPLQKLEGKLDITAYKNPNNQKNYKILYDEFIKEFKKLNIDPKNITWQNILEIRSILEKFISFIPSSTYRTYPDVSLFDHSLATAAISVAIKRGDGYNFSLIQGDFTSIQTFIFSKFGQSNKNLSKILRAKSLFVNIATELISLKVSKELGLSPLSIVLNAGGKFMILAHKLIDKDKEKLNSIRDWINDEFSKINFLQTKFVLKSIDFTNESFKLGEFSKVFKDMATSFEEEKLRFIPKNDVFENYIDKITKNGKCEICGIVTEAPICNYCKKFKELGEKLPKAKYINFNLNDLMSITLSNKKEDELSFGLESYPIKRVANVVPKFSKEDLESKKYSLLKEKFEANEIKDGMIKSFYHIGADGLKFENGKVKGRSYLAILKADIDNLGKIFICGFDRTKEYGKNESTFSRILYLSRMIDYFFTNTLMEYIKDKNVYTVFAGGDDLFLIGHYEDIIKTYKWIIKELKIYTNNSDFHISGAITLTRANIPINLMSEFAEEDLERSKSIEGKDAVTVFDISLKNSEFLEMFEKIEYFKNLYKMLKEVNSGVSFMYKFYDFIRMQKNLNDGKYIIQNAWRYKFRYLIEKNFEEKGKNREKYLEIKKELYKMVGMIEQYGERLIIPLNLFLYSIREGVKDV